MMTDGNVQIGPDGFYHPRSDAEIAALVRRAASQGLQVRVRGSTHSVARAIYTDPLPDQDNRVQRQRPPTGPHINIMLDRLRGWHVRDAARRIVVAEAGIHLGGDPVAPTYDASEQDSLLYQLWTKHRWTLADLGGITHQTVSGFTATGSSGGSLTFSVNTNIYGVRFVDGRGEVRQVTREDSDLSVFHAMVPSMGLLGVVTAVIFECDGAFNIAGEERITTLQACEVDLFGDDPARTTLETWLRQTEYGRLEWWPQPGAERIEAWKVWRIGDDPNFKPDPYRQFGKHPVLIQLAVAILYNIFGNFNNLAAARRNLRPGFRHLREELAKSIRLGPFGSVLAAMAAGAVRALFELITLLITPFANPLSRRMPSIFRWVLNTFIPLDKGKPNRFQDYSWRGLPVDAEVDDVLLPAGFTELWIPLSRGTEVMRLLRNYFDEPQNELEELRRTGLLTWELYAAPPTSFWMNPSFSTGNDEWKDGVVRVDPYWFEGNAGNPAETFFPPLWHLLRKQGIPFRLHWGKYQPVIMNPDPADWVAFFRSQYAHWDDFLRLREQFDPHNVFLTEYWRERFGLD